MACYSLDGLVPVVHPTAYVHPSAVLIGDVIIGPHCYVGPLASLRGDFGRIVLEEGANIQDTCVMHGFPGSDTVVARNGHIGHGGAAQSCATGCGGRCSTCIQSGDNARGQGARGAATAEFLAHPANYRQGRHERPSAAG